MSGPRWSFGVAILAYLAAAPLFGQLVDSTQTSPSVPLGAISKSLNEQIGAGRGDVNTPDSAIYLIQRDPARSIRRGRQLFQRKFTFEQGVGPRVSPHSTGNIQINPALGAGLADSCAACHGRPKGSAGFGGVVATRPDSRDAPHLFGLGLQEMIADEMTQDLRKIRDRAVKRATESGRAVRARLRAKRVDFGSISVTPDGEVDVSRVDGIDGDLRVRPFFAQGSEFSMRAFIVGAFKDEMGLEAADPDLASAALGNKVTTPSGLVLDGLLDTINPPPIADPSDDGDADGVVNEIDTAVVDHLEFYLLNYFKPGSGKQTRSVESGRKLMADIGCTKCHVPSFSIRSDRRVADVETEFDPKQGRFNRLFATATTRFKVVEDEDDESEYPRLVPKREGFFVRNIYTDFKRHDLGAAFHERNYDGSLTTHFVTEPLWGVGSTAPYGHDGRSINLEEVILRHGGEAQRSATAFHAMSERDRRSILDFLNSLVLFPPDDTASNLNPGGSGNPQDPANHGNIDLSQLFQTPGSGE